MSCTSQQHEQATAETKRKKEQEQDVGLMREVFVCDKDRGDRLISKLKDPDKANTMHEVMIAVKKVLELYFGSLKS